LNAELEIDAVGGRIGVLKAPVAGLMPTGFGGFADIMAIHGCAEDLGLSEPEVNNTGVTRGCDSEMKSPGVTRDGVFEQFGLRLEESEDGSVVLEKFKGEPDGEKILESGARGGGAHVLCSPRVDAGGGAGPKSFAGVGVEGVREHAGLGVGSAIGRGQCPGDAKADRGCDCRERKEIGVGYEQGFQERRKQ